MPFHITIFAPRWLRGPDDVDNDCSGSFAQLVKEGVFIYYKPPFASSSFQEGHAEDSDTQSDVSDTLKRRDDNPEHGTGKLLYAL